MQYQTNILRFYWHIIRPYKWWMLLMLQAPIIGSFFIPANNYALKLIIDHISANQVFALQDIIFPVAIYCAASIILELAWRVANFADYKSQPHIETEIINQGYKMLLSHHFSFFQNNLSGKLASKISTLRDKYVSILDQFYFSLIWRSLTIIITLVIFFFVNSQLALGVGAWLIIFMPALFYTKIKGISLSDRSAKEKQHITGLINDGISNISNILFFGGRNQESSRLKDANQNFITSEKKCLKFIFFNHLAIGAVYCLLSISVLFLLINLRQKNLISIGDFVMTIGLLYNFIETTWMILNDSDVVIQEYGQLREAFAIFDHKNIMVEKSEKKAILIKNPQISFQNVNFNYSDNAVFENFNLKIEAGQKIGLVGHSGAGKSSLISLLLKIFDINSGQIFIDNYDITQINSEDVRANIALIPQDPFLFHRSIYENIAYSKFGCHHDEVVAAAKMAHIHDFISNLPLGYDTMVGERGIKLSGGQRQRIAIARAILKNAPILILDEATAALDSMTESDIQDSINLMLQKRNITVIAVAHRLSTIKHMDRIIVLNEGKIVEDGSFVELLAKNNGHFRKMWQHQANGMIS